MSCGENSKHAHHASRITHHASCRVPTVLLLCLAMFEQPTSVGHETPTQIPKYGSENGDFNLVVVVDIINTLRAFESHDSCAEIARV